MPCAMLEFEGLPQIGFAHHFQMQHYEQNHKKTEDSLEIVYIKEGAVIVESHHQTFHAESGSILVLFRDAPFHIRSADDTLHRHCSVQLQMPHRLRCLV